MEPVAGYGGYTCSPAPGVTGPDEYAGVDLSTLLETVGGLTAKSVVSVAASDGYVVTLIADQLQSGSYVTCDPKSGKRARVEELPRAVVAYAKAGAPLGNDEGPLCSLF